MKYDFKLCRKNYADDIIQLKHDMGQLYVYFVARTQTTNDDNCTCYKDTYVKSNEPGNIL